MRCAAQVCRSVVGQGLQVLCHNLHPHFLFTFPGSGRLESVRDKEPDGSKDLLPLSSGGDGHLAGIPGCHFNRLSSHPGREPKKMTALAISLIFHIPLRFDEAQEQRWESVVYRT